VNAVFRCPQGKKKKKKKKEKGRQRPPRRSLSIPSETGLRGLRSGGEGEKKKKKTRPAAVPRVSTTGKGKKNWGELHYRCAERRREVGKKGGNICSLYTVSPLWQMGGRGKRRGTR